MKDLTLNNSYKSTFKTLFLFAIPLIISGVISQTYNLIDLIIAGKIIGSDALSATGATSTFIQFLSSIFWGFGVAASTTVGELYGQKNNKRICKNIKTTLVFVTSIMFVVCFACFTFSKQILTMLKVDPLIFDLAKSYFEIYMISLLIQAFVYQVTSILASLGNSKYPMIVNIVSGLLNVIFNVIFVVFFDMGVKGLAYATLFSCVISLLLCLYKIFKTFKELNEPKKISFSLTELKFTGKLAIPCILQQCSLYLASVVVQPIINAMGKDVSAGYSIAMNAYLIFNAFFHSFSRANAAYISQSMGSKKYQNFTKGIRITFIQQMMMVVPLVILTIIFPNQIFSIFLKDNDPSVLKYATQYAYLCLPFLPICAYGNLMHSFYKAVEAGRSVLICTIIYAISRILFSYFLPSGNYLFAIYLAISIAWCIESISLFVVYKSKLWMNKEMKGVI